MSDYCYSELVDPLYLVKAQTMTQRGEPQPNGALLSSYILMSVVNTQNPQWRPGLQPSGR